MDLSSFMSWYFTSIVEIVVYLQWAQVYKVISNPLKAKESMIQNWAARIECVAVLLCTCLLISGIFICIFHDSDFDDLEDN